MSTIRVTVGDSGAGFDLPALSETQRHLLRLVDQHGGKLARQQMPVEDYYGDYRPLIEYGLLREHTLAVWLTPLGRAVLEHYEAQR